MACALVVAAAFAVFEEWAHYKLLLDWMATDLASYEQLILVWVLVAKSLWLLALPLALVVFLATRGRTRAARIVAAVAGGFTFTWLAIDIRVAQATRNNLSHYLAFLAERDAWQWGGGAASIVPAVLAVLAAAVLSAGAALWFFHRLAGDVARRWSGAAGRRGARDARRALRHDHPRRDPRRERAGAPQRRRRAQRDAPGDAAPPAGI